MTKAIKEITYFCSLKRADVLEKNVELAGFLFKWMMKFSCILPKKMSHFIQSAFRNTRIRINYYRVQWIWINCAGNQWNRRGSSHKMKRSISPPTTIVIMRIICFSATVFRNSWSRNICSYSKYFIHTYMPDESETLISI